jgi:hypothetical protein
MEYSPGLMWFHSFIYSYIFLIRLAYRHLDEHVVDTVKELWILNLQLMFDGSCGLDVSQVGLCATSCTILFFFPFVYLE